MDISRSVKLMTLNRKYQLIIITSVGLLLSGVYSMRWWLPCILNGSFSGYVPPIYHLIGTAGLDENQYFTMAKWLWQETLYIKIPDYYNIDNSISVFNVYLLGLMPVKLLYIATGDMIITYIITYTIFPFLNFILIYKLTKKITKHFEFSLFCAFVLVSISWLSMSIPMYFSDGVDYLNIHYLQRFVNILSTNVFLFLFVLLVLSSYKFRGLRTTIVASLSLGLIMYTSIQNTIFAFFFFVSFQIFIYKKDWKNWLISLGTAFVIALPAIYFMWNSVNILDLSKDLRAAVSPNSWFYYQRYIKFTLFNALPMLFFTGLYFKKKKNALPLVIVGCFIFVFYVLLMTIGLYASNKYLSRGPHILAFCVTFACIFLLLRDFYDKYKPIITKKVRSHSLVPSEKKVLKIFAISIVISITIALLLNQYSVYSKSHEHYHQPEFVELNNWINSLPEKKIFLSTNLEYCLSAPAFIDSYLFLPYWPLIMPTWHWQLKKAFSLFEFYGDDGSKLKEILTDYILYKKQKNGAVIRRQLEPLIKYLFTRKFYRASHNKDAYLIDEICTEYDGFLNENEVSTLPDYVIVTGNDFLKAAEGSRAAQFITGKPIYQNIKYKVYKIE